MHCITAVEAKHNSFGKELSQLLLRLKSMWMSIMDS